MERGYLGLVLIFAAAMASSLAYAQGANEGGTLVVSVSYATSAPSNLIVQKVGNTRPKDRIIVPAVRTAARTSLFKTELAPGDYELLGINAALPSGPYLVPYQADIAMRPLNKADATFTLGAEQTLDLGRVWVDDLGGNLSLLLRDTSAVTNQSLLADVNDDVHVESDAATTTKVWATAVSDVEVQLLARVKHRALGISPPVELKNGQWQAFATSGEVLQRSAEGQWRVAASLQARLLSAFSRIGDDDFVLAAEFGELFHGDTQIGQLPEGTPKHLHCNAAFACVAMLVRPDAYVLVHSADVRTGQWQELNKTAQGVSFWTGPTTVTAYRVGDETVVFPGKKILWRINPSQGKLEISSLDFKPFMPLVSADRITVRGRYSDDAGRTWQSLNTRMRDGLAQFDGQGNAWASSFNMGMVVSQPILRRSPDGVTGWETVGQLPATGELSVGRYSPVMFLKEMFQQGAPWVSIDQGKTWSPDLALYQLVEKK